jgi:hypothetical protein
MAVWQYSRSASHDVRIGFFEYPRPRHAVAHSLHQFQLEHDTVADAIDLLQPGTGRGQNVVEVPEPRDEAFGQGFGVAARDGAIQDHLEKFVIRHRIRAALAEPLSQAIPMLVAMRLRPFGRASGLADRVRLQKLGGDFFEGERGLLGHGRNLPPNG